LGENSFFHIKIAKVHSICFELSENVAMVLFIGYHCNFPLQKCHQLRWNYLGMLIIMVPLQNWKKNKKCRDHKKSKFLGIWDHLRRTLTIFGFLKTSLVRRISLDGTIILIRWNSSSHHYIYYGPKSIKGFHLPPPHLGFLQRKILERLFSIIDLDTWKIILKLSLVGIMNQRMKMCLWQSNHVLGGMRG
jgi:hypothetical protein